MDLITVTFLIFSGFISSTISGMTGLAGGVILFSLLTQKFPLEVVIPLHALCQVIANLNRLLVFRKDIDLKKFFFFSLATLPGAYLGAEISQLIEHHVLNVFIGLIIVGISFKNILLKTKTSSPSKKVDYFFSLIGFIGSMVGTIVGIVGPFIAPLFLFSGLEGKKFIATKSACQFMTQLSKVLIFTTLLKTNMTQLSTQAIYILPGIFIGTIIAKYILEKINLKILNIIINLCLVIIGINLILKAN